MDKKKLEFKDRDRYAMLDSIPPERVIRAERVECNGGYSTVVLRDTNGNERWSGCGHPRCQMCKFGKASGVGDDAIRAFRKAWLRKIRNGDDVPAYVRWFVNRRQDKEEWKI